MALPPCPSDPILSCQGTGMQPSVQPGVAGSQASTQTNEQSGMPHG